MARLLLLERELSILWQLGYPNCNETEAKISLKMKVGKSMFSKTKMQKIVGIDIQKNCIRYCTQKGGKFIYGELVINGTIFKDDKLRQAESLVSAFREISKRLKMQSFNVVLTALNSRLLIRQIPLGNMKTEKEIREYIYLELGESISLPFENPIFDVLILEPSKNKKPQQSRKTKGKKQAGQSMVIQRNRFAVNGKVPVIVTSEPILIELGDVLQKAGLKLVGVDCSALAYTRICHKQINWTENFVLVELDAGVANITFFEELVPTYTQYEDYNQVNWKFMETEQTVQVDFRESTEIEALKKLATTTNDLIQYFLQDLSPDCDLAKIYVVGGHPLLKKEVIDLFAARIDLPVKSLSPRVNEKMKKRLPNRFLLAAGLASKEV